MATITVCRTKAGAGIKAVVDGVWYYTSIPEFIAMMNGKSRACKFRTLDEFHVVGNNYEDVPLA